MYELVKGWDALRLPAAVVLDGKAVKARGGGTRSTNLVLMPLNWPGGAINRPAQLLSTLSLC